MKSIDKILEFGSSPEKIEVLEKLALTNDFEIIKKIIIALDDKDVQVRGEAFSSLILNKNNISKLLIESLNDERKNVRGFSSLILANRNDFDAIPAIIELVNDDNSMVSSCALGALGYLKAKEAKKVMREKMFDSNIEVRKSALQALININEKISEKDLLEISKETDSEIENLVIRLKKGGPEGI